MSAPRISGFRYGDERIGLRPAARLTEIGGDGRNRTEQEVCRFNQAEIHRSAARDGGKSSGVVKKSPTTPYTVRGIALNVVASGAAAVAPALRMQSTGAIVGPFLGAFRHTASLQEITMSHIITRQRTLSVFEHLLAIVVGFVLMVLGLGLSVTMIMLPIGLIVGLAGFAMFVSGICVRFDWI